MKAQGLLAVILIAVLAFAGTAAAYDASVYSMDKPDFADKYGIEVNGGFSMFALGDINDYFALTPGYNSLDEGQFGIGGGAAILYRSHERFRWTVGYSFLGQETSSASFYSSSDNATYTDESTVTGSEFYVLGNYLVPLTERFDLALGLGVGIVNAGHDRVINNDSPSTGASRYDATGRSMSARMQVGVEFRVLENVGINLQGGYRMANVPKLTYEDRSLTDADGNPLEQTLYWGTGNRTINADFSGAFVELGVRLYFAPATNWFSNQ